MRQHNRKAIYGWLTAYLTFVVTTAFTRGGFDMFVAGVILASVALVPALWLLLRTARELRVSHEQGNQKRWRLFDAATGRVVETRDNAPYHVRVREAGLLSATTVLSAATVASMLPQTSEVDEAEWNHDHWRADSSVAQGVPVVHVEEHDHWRDLVDAQMYPNGFDSLYGSADTSSSSSNYD